MPVQAVSFDFDGTIANSVNAIRKANIIIAKILASILGIDEEPVVKYLERKAEKLSLKGKYNRALWIKETLSYFNRKIEETTISLLVRKYWTYVITRTTLYSDAEYTIATLKKKGYLVAILTNTDGTIGVKSKRISKLVSKDLFDAIVIAGEDTDNPKPHPEAFYYLAKKLGVKPSEIVYVGDDYLVDAIGSLRAGFSPALILRSHLRFKVNKKPLEEILVVNRLSDILLYL